MLCPECQKSFINFKKYILHLDISHKITDYFLCPVANCTRTYDTKYSLKDHMTVFHKLFTERKLDSNEIDACGSIESHSLNMTEQAYCEPNTDDTVLSTNTKPIDDCDYNLEDELNQFQRGLNSNVIDFIIKLYSTLNFPRSKVKKLLESVKSLLANIMFPVKEITKVLESKDKFDKIGFKTMNRVFDMIENCFDPFDTEHKILNYFTAVEKFVPPEKTKIGESKAPKRKCTILMQLKDEFVYLMPLKKTLKLFLELPNVLNTILEYQRNINIDDGVLRNVVNGTLWKTQTENVTGIVIPLYVFYDDFESGNPLGSHAGKHKIGAVYSCIGTVPPQYASRLENVFLTLLFYSNQRSKFGNQKVFTPLLSELKFLETTGLNISHDNRELNIKFTLIVLCGDNLGLNSILGCVESFSANVYCRVCTMEKRECQTAVIEKQEKMRKQQNYNYYLENNVGLKENCIWHTLRRFHICDNTSVDVMHDLCEGVHRYSMACIIQSLIRKKYFTLEQLNARTRYFNYSKMENNHPPAITKQHLNNGSIIISASEMLCLVRNFRYIIGDLVLENDEIWDYYLILLELTETLTSQIIPTQHIENLEELIKEHHEMYMELFQTHLKPKYHFLLHYPSIIKKCGPPIFYSAFKFEAKHKDLKRVSQSITSRKNLCYSIGLRCELKNCSRYLSNKGFEDNIKFSKQSHLNIPMGLENDYFSVSTYEINGIIYDTRSVLLYECVNDEPDFRIIRNILVSNTDFKSMSLSCNRLRICGYGEHFKAYLVENSADSNCDLIPLTAFCDQLPMQLRSASGTLYISFYK